MINDFEAVAAGYFITAHNFGILRENKYSTAYKYMREKSWKELFECCEQSIREYCGCGDNDRYKLFEEEAILWSKDIKNNSTSIEMWEEIKTKANSVLKSV